MKKLSLAKILLICIMAFAVFSLSSCDAITDKLPDSIKNLIPGLDKDGDSDVTANPDDNGDNTGDNNNSGNTDNNGGDAPGSDTGNDGSNNDNTDGSGNNGTPDSGTTSPETPDETAPTVTVTVDKTAYAVGDTVAITVTATDDRTPADKLTIVVKVTKDGENVTVTNNTFVAESAGEYIIRAEVNDEVGNFTPTEIKVNAIAAYNFDHAGTEADPFSVANALSIAGGLAEGETTPLKYYFTGIVTTISTNKNGLVTFTIVDGDDSIYCYGLYKTEDVPFGTAEGATLEGIPQKNDTVVLYANVKNHYNTLELTNCLLTSLTEGVHEERAPIVAEELEYSNILPTDNGKYKYIFATQIDGVKYLMKNTLENGRAYNSAATAENIFVDEFVWEINIQDGKISFFNGTGYLQWADSTKFKIVSEEVFWNITEEDGKPLIRHAENNRLLAAATSTKYFGAYVYPATSSQNFTTTILFVEAE